MSSAIRNERKATLAVGCAKTESPPGHADPKPLTCRHGRTQPRPQTPTPAEHRTKIRGNQRATGHHGKGEEAPPSTKENQPLSLRYFSRKYGPNRPSGPSTKKIAGARRTAAGRRWHGRQPWRTGGFPARVPRRPTFFSRKDGPNRPSGPSTKKIAGARRTAAGRRWHGRQPWRTGGFPARVPRRPTFFSRKDGPNRPSGPSTKKIAGARRAAAGRRWHGRQPWRTGGFPARVPRRPTFFSRKDGPNRPSGPSTKKFAGARRTAASRWWFRPQPWWPRGFTAHGPRRPTFSPANMVQSVRKGASPEKFAGPRRTTAGERWPDISSAHGGGGRKKSPHMAFVAYEFSISSDSDDVSSSCNLPTPIIDSQFFVKNDPQQPKCLWRRTKFWEASPTHGPPTGSLLAWPKLLLA